MTEDVWLACTDPAPMLESLRGKASRRKFGLWVVACHRAWLPAHFPFRQAVDVVERYAEGEAGDAELQAMHQRHHTSLVLIGHGDPCDFASFQINYFRRVPQPLPTELLRCIVGNPFRPVAYEPSWGPQNAVVLSRTMYDSRDFTLMPLLADLLEEVGCPADVARHCQGPGPHVRGCWVVDLVLGRE